MRRMMVLGMAMLTTGCCGTGGGRPVYLETSLARLELPERPSRVVRLSGGVTSSAYVVLSPDQIATAPSAQEAKATEDDPDTSGCGGDEEKGLYGRIDLCLGKRLSLGASRRHNGPTLGHVRLYLAGREREKAKAGNFSMALTGAYGNDKFSETDRTQDGDYVSRARRKQSDVGLVLGYRLGKAALLYGGPYRLRTGYELEHERPNTAIQRSSGRAIASGGHLGLGLFAGRHSSWLIEYSRAKIDTGAEDEVLSNWSANYQLDF